MQFRTEELQATQFRVAFMAKVSAQARQLQLVWLQSLRVLFTSTSIHPTSGTLVHVLLQNKHEVLVASRT
jgi:hypothetical protein